MQQLESLFSLRLRLQTINGMAWHGMEWFAQQHVNTDLDNAYFHNTNNYNVQSENCFCFRSKFTFRCFIQIDAYKYILHFVYKFFPFGQYELVENWLSFFWLSIQHNTIQYNTPLDRSKPSFYTQTHTSTIYTFNPGCCCCSLCIVIEIHRRFFLSLVLDIRKGANTICVGNSNESVLPMLPNNKIYSLSWC